MNTPESDKGRKIHCKPCGTHLGIIRDAKLHKDITYLCSKCETKRLASDWANKTKPNRYGDIFKGFGL